MLSLDLFDSKFERQLREGAVDRLEQHRIDVLNDRMQELLARARTASPDTKEALKQQYEKIKSERDSYYKIREAQKGQDVVDRSAKMKALTPAKPGVAGAVKDVAQGLKSFLQGKPETGPTYEADQKKSLELDHGVIPTEPLPEAGGWALDPKTRLELRRRQQRNKTIAKYAGRKQEDWISKLSPEEISKIAGPNYEKINQQRKADKIKEHGGGIGPKQRWQDLMPEGWSDKFDLTPYGVYIDGRQWKEFSSDEHARAVADKVRASLAKQGRKQTVTIAPSEAWQKQRRIKEGVVQDALRDYLGVTGADDADAVRAAIDKIGRDTSLKPTSKRRLIGQIGMMVNKYQVPVGHKYYQYMQRFMEESRKINENAEPSPVESAILQRIFVAHKELLVNYGPEKVMQAAEDVAYNVGDHDEIGSSDVSGWVRQVEQILGARP